MSRPRRLLNSAALVLATALLLVTAGILDAPLFAVYRIAGNSMRPAFRDGDRVLVSGLALRLAGIGVGDAVIAQHSGDTLIKRIVGLPGDAIEFRDGICFRNGQAVEAPLPQPFCDLYSEAPVCLGSDEFFVAGDNRRVSIDSRCFGPVRRDEIVGKVLMRLESDHEAATAAERGGGATAAGR
jgi:signal peptidase I